MEDKNSSPITLYGSLKPDTSSRCEPGYAETGTSFTMTPNTSSGDLTELQREAVEWANRNNHDIFTDEKPQGIWLQVKVTEFKSIFVDPHGNVDLQQRMNLGGEAGDVRFGEKQMTVENDRGERYYVSRKKWPM